MGKAVAIVGTGEAVTDKDACKHKTNNGPKPNTNKAKLALAKDSSQTVFVNGDSVILLKSHINISSGCTGLNGVVSSKPPNGPCTMERSSLSVFIEDSGVVRKGDKTSNDSGNADGQITDGSDNVFAGG